MPESKPFADQANVIAADLALKFDMQNMITKLTGQLAVAQERIVTLEKALKAVEWGIPIYGTTLIGLKAELSYRQCPSCSAPDRPDFMGPEGHFPDCQLAAALADCDHRGDCIHIEAAEAAQEAREGR